MAGNECAVRGMEINKENAIKLWRSRYGNKDWIQDYNNRNSRRQSTSDGHYYNYGWNLHHMMPESKASCSPKMKRKVTSKSNLEIVHIFTNDEAEDKTTFIINDTEYQVRSLRDGSGNYGIFDTSNNRRVDYPNK